MFRANGGWGKIVHIFGGCMQHSFTHSGKKVVRNNFRIKRRSVGGNISSIPPFLSSDFSQPVFS